MRFFYLLPFGGSHVVGDVFYCAGEDDFLAREKHRLFGVEKSGEHIARPLLEGHSSRPEIFRQFGDSRLRRAPAQAAVELVDCRIFFQVFTPFVKPNAA